MSVRSPFDLSGQAAMVTGAGQGLGFAVAKAIAQAGAVVIATGRNSEQLAKAVASIGKDGGQALPLTFDISDPAASQRAIKDIVSAHGRLDIVVNNVGKRDRRGLFAFTLDDVRQLLEVDLIAPFHISREASKVMIAAKYGRIVNITSISGQLARSGDTPYTVAWKL
jgi:gluconate 5-dehydrogenase